MGLIKPIIIVLPFIIVLTAQSIDQLKGSVDNFMDELGGKEVPASNTDHIHHQHHHMENGHMMKMWFHGGYNEVILFDFWRTDSLFGVLLSCAAIFIMGATYEGVKWFRVYLSQHSTVCTNFNHNKSCVEIALQTTRGSNNLTNSRNQTSSSKVLQNEPLVIGTSSTRINGLRSLTFQQRFSPFSTQRLIQGSLYIIQLILAYWLMLIVMTYNTYLTIAVVLGAGFGHWLFAVLQLRNSDGETTDSFQTDACH